MFPARIFIFLAFSATVVVRGRYFGDRESFYQELIQRYRLPPNEASIWNCLADNHSGFRSHLKSHDPVKGEDTYGILQINGNLWCADGKNLCELPCEKLLDDDLTDDIQCARRIYQVQGLKAWEAWERRCQGRMDEYEPNYKHAERCEFARKLYYQEGVPGSMLATVVCIAEEESGFNVNTQGGPYKDGFRTFGLFRISGEWWCNEGHPESKQLCGIPCTSLLDNQITDDVQCVMSIFNYTARYREDQDGFFAWDSYEKRCKDPHKNQGMIKDCFTEREFASIFATAYAIPTSTHAPVGPATTQRLPPWITIRTPTSPATLPPPTRRQEIQSVQPGKKKNRKCWTQYYPVQQVLRLDIEEECFTQ